MSHVAKLAEIIETCKKSFIFIFHPLEFVTHRGQFVKMCHFHHVHFELFHYLCGDELIINNS